MSLAKLKQQLTTSGNNEIYRFIAIDPGTDTLGLSLCEINLKSLEFKVCDVITLYASKNMSFYPGVIETHGEKQARLYAHRRSLVDLFNYWRPDAIVSESPFLGRFAAAFGALVECMQIIREAVMEYRPYMELETVDPPSAKKSMNVKAKGSSKDDIQRAVISDTTIVFADGLSRLGHSEHGYDSIAVAKWKYLNFIGRW